MEQERENNLCQAVPNIITQWKPSIAEAKAMPKDYSSMSNDCVLLMATHGDQNAKEERLRREIMAVDEVDYEKASETFLKIAQYNRIGSFRRTLPYKLGILGGISGAFVSIPLVFNLKTALWFNREYVTTDVPEPRDLETWLEVGAWTWNWMEPVLGHISFFLLALAFARAQMLNLGVAPYTNFVRNRRANSVADKFSQYDRKIVTDYSLHSPW
eukprot:CAMPEP_0201492328 /NCGR_PEP_ID=MMETSP0151_2-20130828/32660_1 /ASSEMBLY_ACC=CAM_ASM_000257 /TAXON_ID=200890 /ORGANISM="Paramoeba atlantica, Strain 621/1 / CCAP 1560/9" /LENGTH=213 /DNA_ID=CAMNT_0047879073 /DNA_START=186 /DNA_END=828 /DNA_ORIENTATION=+